MTTPSSSMRQLARRLVAAGRPGHGPGANDPSLVSEDLRKTLTRFAGADGFASLLRRALALASVTCPALKGVKVGAEGRLEGLEQLTAEAGAGVEESRRAAVIAITAQLLELLETFIGTTLTLKLIQDAWPDTPLGEAKERIEDEE